MSHVNRIFFDQMAPIWDNATTVYPDKIRYILAVAGVEKADRVLDVGTGTGVLIPYIEEIIGPEGHIDAVDISPCMIEKARKKHADYTNIDFTVANIETDTLADTYDRILMFCVLPHLENPTDTLRWLISVNLRPGGSLTIGFPESKDSINTIHHHNDGSCHSTKLRPASDFKAELALMGLEVDYVEDNDDYYIIRLRKGDKPKI